MRVVISLDRVVRGPAGEAVRVSGRMTGKAWRD